MNITRIFIPVLMSLILTLPSGAQIRKSYPLPTRTAEVEQLIGGRKKWEATRAKASLPTAVDNSKLTFFPPIINQKGGSCAQASGIGYMFTYEMNRLLNRDASAGDSNTFSYLFTWNFLNGGVDEGGFVEQGLNIARNFGVMTEADYGYASTYQFKWASGYEKYLNAARYRVKELYDFSALSSDDIETIKRYLYDRGNGSPYGGVLTFSTLSTDWKINDRYDGPSETGYHSLLTALASKGAHALTIAGYDDTVESTDSNGKKHLGAFIVVNSWGRQSHDNGRFYLPYHFFENRGPSVNEAQLSSTMTGIEVCIHEPKVVFKLCLSYSSRDDVSLVYGASDDKASTHPQERFNLPVFRNQGGDYAMQGSYPVNETIELALDYTPHLSAPDHRYARYFLNIICSQRGSKSGKGTVRHLSVMDYRTDGEPAEYTCREIDNTPLKWGNNLFAIPALPRFTTSASHFRWLDSNLSPSGKTYLIRTAKGKHAKLRIVGYDPQTGKTTLHYFYQGDNSRKLTQE